ncbi:MAG TPA: hypothetical protein VJN95_10120 [Gemmatimonadales bacterium]|nr:hypothetical protein [Gemmatimonadales bacterium]
MPAETPESPERKTLSEAEARRLLARAAELDARHASDHPLARLREVAIEAGIAESAFDRALQEFEVRDRSALSSNEGDSPSRDRSGEQAFPTRRAGAWQLLARFRGHVIVAGLLVAALARPADAVARSLVIAAVVVGLFELALRLHRADHRTPDPGTGSPADAAQAPRVKEGEVPAPGQQSRQELRFAAPHTAI